MKRPFLVQTQRMLFSMLMVFLTLTALGGQGEDSLWTSFRTWTSLQGNTVNARWVPDAQVADGYIVLEQRDGKRLKVLIENLSDKDLRYVASFHSTQETAPKPATTPFRFPSSASPQPTRLSPEEPEGTTPVRPTHTSAPSKTGREGSMNTKFILFLSACAVLVALWLANSTRLKNQRQVESSLDRSSAVTQQEQCVKTNNSAGAVIVLMLIIWRLAAWIGTGLACYNWLKPTSFIGVVWFIAAWHIATWVVGVLFPAILMTLFDL